MLIKSPARFSIVIRKGFFSLGSTQIIEQPLTAVSETGQKTFFHFCLSGKQKRKPAHFFSFFSLCLPFLILYSPLLVSVLSLGSLSSFPFFSPCLGSSSWFPVFVPYLCSLSSFPVFAPCFFSALETSRV